jgi:signal transduction histidine kinase
VRRAALAIGPGIVVLAFGALAYDGVQRSQISRERVAHSRDVIDQAQATFSALQDVETGQRGYIITGDTAYLAPYERALGGLRADMAALGELTRDNPTQQHRLDSLSVEVDTKLAELAETIEFRRRSGFAAAEVVIHTDRGKLAMEAVRSTLGDFVAEERRLLATRAESEAGWRRIVTIILVGGTILGVVLSLLLTATLLGHAEQEVRTAKLLEEQHRELQGQASELEMQAQQLQEQAAELEMQNEALEAAKVEADRGRADAEAANRSKTEFLSVMSHELRTPLNAIAGHAQLVEMGVHGPVTDAQRDAMERLRRSQTHLLYLINDLLNLARIESGRVEYNLEDVPLIDVLHDMTPMVEPQFAAKDIDFEITVPPDCVVRADREKLQQILINLLGNAAKFTPAGGRVTVTCGTRVGSPPNNVYLRVRDTGPGIARSKQESIFEPFVQLDRKQGQTAQGVGLGLAIARDLARGMGGDLRVRSEVAEGAVFTLTLREG